MTKSVLSLASRDLFWWKKISGSAGICFKKEGFVEAVSCKGLNNYNFFAMNIQLGCKKRISKNEIFKKNPSKTRVNDFLMVN